MLGVLAGSVWRVRREHVERAVAHASCGEPRGTAARMYRSLGIGVFELLWVLGQPRRPLGAVASLSPELSRLLGRSGLTGRPNRTGVRMGVVLATAHTGNWDLSACALARAGVPLTVVTKRLKVQWLDHYWQSARSEQGIELLDGAGSFARTARALRDGRMVALVIDQAPERVSAVMQAPFLGRSARCDLTPALLAARTGATLALVLGRRLEDGTHRIEVRLTLVPPPRAGRAWAEAATAALQAALEGFVREHPAQWLWLHRRWKGLASPAPSPTRLVTARARS